MRRRDIHALLFCACTIALLFACVMLALHSVVIALCLTAAYAAILFTRPRMIRVWGRLRGRRYGEWRGYYDG